MILVINSVLEVVYLLLHAKGIVAETVLRSIPEVVPLKEDRARHEVNGGDPVVLLNSLYKDLLTVFYMPRIVRGIVDALFMKVPDPLPTTGPVSYSPLTLPTTPYV